jgi:hypothetical protein
MIWSRNPLIRKEQDFGHRIAIVNPGFTMFTRRTAELLLVAYLLISSYDFAQTSIPLPPEVEQLSAWRVSYPEWFHDWETEEMRCGIDDPTLHHVVRLDGGPASLDFRTASRQVEELDRKIVRDLKKHGWSQMKSAASEIPERNRCLQKGDSFVQVRKQCASRSCTFYQGITLTYYLRIPSGTPP